ncbi:hypothetical protein BJ986_000339 [Phycicoccus badiiscoriae]|uniref:DUF4439 domain-containing protein n=1 Tax=Pedococcus badiiscoriae TaxID=642776 RepID=A0A852WKQ1_9MICO|nr:DUF4439 domain-containing protein [Pedococcus badiiscoriae]NYG05852.1 hypothetical protein [Pedococcus badiiscoriae]
MPQDDTRMPACPSRRRVLTLGLGLGLGAVTAGSLAACGIRLEDNAPQLPLIPKRPPVPSESFLLALWRHSEDLAIRAASLRGPATSVPARLAALHRRQVVVLETELLRLGVPATALDAAARSSTRPTGTSTAASTGSKATGAAGTASALHGPKGLGAEEASDLGPTAISSLAKVPTAAIPLVGSVLAQRSAAAALLGAPAPWPGSNWSATSLAASYLESTRAAVYAFQVVAAQSPSGAQHAQALATLATLEARAQDQESLAGASAGPPALGYPLPFPVTTPAAARKLAVQVLTELRASVARDLGSTGGDTGPLGALVQWLADTEVLASRWGVPLSAFPGLT